MKRILLIDDEETILQFNKQCLELAGYTTTMTRNGNEALSLLKTNKFDLIITDILMPEKDGIEVIIDVTKNYPNIKLIAVSGGGNMAAYNYLSVVKMFGIVHTLEKPYNNSQLLELVNTVLND